MPAPLRPTSVPGVYQRGSRWLAVYRVDGRQRRRSAATFREAREIKIRRSAEEAARRAGPTLHAYALAWVDHYAGRGANDVINNRTRREYRRLLIAYALKYFAPEEPLRTINEQRARAFVDWLCRHTDDNGRRLSDRSVRNAVMPLQACLRHAARSGLIAADRRRSSCCLGADAVAPTSSTNGGFSRAAKSRPCSPKSPVGGGHSLSCSSRPACGSLRRSRCA